MSVSLQAYAPLIGYAAAALFTPGPNNAMLAASGAQFGFWRTRAHILGVGLGFALMLFPVALGLGAAVERIPALNLAMTLIGAALLLWMSWRIAFAPVGDPPAADAEETTARQPLTFLQAAGFQWINPKGWTIALGVAASHMSGASPLREALICVAIFAAMGLISAGAWASFGAAIGAWLTNPLRRRIFNLSMGGILAGFVLMGLVKLF